MKGNDSTDQGKTKHTKKYIYRSCNLITKTTQGPTGLYEPFLLTVSTEEIARWEYKTVLTIFPLNLLTITIALDVIKWR